MKTGTRQAPGKHYPGVPASHSIPRLMCDLQPSSSQGRARFHPTAHEPHSFPGLLEPLWLISQLWDSAHSNVHGQQSSARSVGPQPSQLREWNLIFRMDVCQRHVLPALQDTPNPGSPKSTSPTHCCFVSSPA